MTDPLTNGSDSLSLSAEVRVDEVCRRFEAAWKQQPPPRLSDFLGDTTGTERLALLRELIRLDLAYRRAGNESPRSVDYLAQFPDLDPTWVADVIRADLHATEGLRARNSDSGQRADSTATGIADDSRIFANRPLDADQTPLPEVDGYEMMRELGRGGMGVVYQARQRALKRIVALKMIRLAKHSGRDELKRFRQEAEAVARLQHPNIVQIHEVGEAAELPFFSLEYVEGGNLRDSLAGTPQPPAEAARLVETLARAMNYAHQKGVIHRDLKPANILLRRKSEAQNPNSEKTDHSDSGFRISDFEPKVTDFGLAKQLDDDSGSTQTGMVLGTPSYMSPEQAAGLTGEIGPLTDVYALGAILYECLTGRPPFRGASSRDTIDQVCTVDPVPPSRLQPGVPPDLETICLACLHKQPARRYATALALADDLRRFVNGEPIHARRTGTLERGAKWVRRRPAIASLLGAVVTVAIVGFILVTHQWFRAEGEKLIAEGARNQAVREAEAAENARIKEAEQRVIADDARKDEQKQKEIAQGKQKEAEEAKLKEEAAKKEEQKQKEIAVKNETDAVEARKQAQANADEAERRRVEAEDSAYQARRALGSTRVAQAQVALNDNNLGLAVDLLDSVSPEVRFWDWHFLKRQCEGGPISFPDVRGFVAFSPDGRYLASSRGTEIQLLDLSDGGKQRDLKAHAGVVVTPPYIVGNAPQYHAVLAFSPESKRLISAGEDKTVRVWDVAAGKELLCFKEHTNPVRALAVSPDGKQVASGSIDGIYLWDPQDGKIAQRLSGQGGEVIALAWLADGKSLLAARRDKIADMSGPAVSGEFKLWDASTGKPIRTFSHPSLKLIQALAVTPDGSQFAAAAAGNDIKVFEMDSGKEVRALSGSSRPGIDICISPDGRQWAALALDGSIRCWDVATGREQAHFTVNMATHARLAFTPDGRYLAASSESLDLWPAQSGTPATLVHSAGNGVTSLAWAPDGRRLATGGKGAVRVWDVVTSQLLQTLSGDSNTNYMAVSWSPDGKIIVGGSSNGFISTKSEVRAWSAETGKEIWKDPNLPGEVLVVTFSPNGKSVAVGCGTISQGQIVQFDPASGRELLKFDAGKGAIIRLSWSSDSKRLASIEVINRYVAIWDAETGKEVNRLLAHQGPVSTLAYSPDGRYLATGGTPSAGDPRGEVKLWDRRTGREARVMRAPGRGIDGLAFSPDGERLVAQCSEGGIRVWDTANGQEVVSILAGVRMAITQVVAFNPEGTRLAVAVNGELYIYDGRPTREVLVQKQRSTGVVWMAATADRQRLLSKEDDGTIRIWDGATRRLLFTRPGGPFNNRAVAFHLDRERLACAFEKSAVVVDIRTGKPTLTLGGHDSMVWGVFYSRDGRTLASVSGGYDGKGGPAPVRILLHDTGSGRERLRFEGPPELAAALSFDLDLTLVGAYQKGGTSKVWDLKGGEPKVVKDFARQREVAWEFEGHKARLEQLTAGWTDGIRVSDARPVPADEEARQAALRPDPQWHLSQAQSAVIQRQWGAAIFHSDQLRKLAPERKADPRGDAVLATSLHNYAESLAMTGRQREAAQGFRRSVALLDGLIPSQPKDYWLRANRANSRVYLGRCLAAITEYKEAETEIAEGVKEFEQLAREYPQQPEFRKSVSWACDVFAQLLNERKKPDEAERWFKKSIEEAQALVEKTPTFLMGHYTLAGAYHNYANALRTAGRSAEAIDYYRKSDAELSPLVKNAPLNFLFKHDLANTLLLLGKLQGESGTWTDAEGPMRRALALYRERVTRTPADLSAQWELATSLAVFSEVAMRHGKTAETEEALEEALEVAKGIVARDADVSRYRDDLASIYHQYAIFLLKVLERPRAAESGFRHAIELMQKSVAELPDLAQVRRNLANSRLYLGKTLTAQGRAREAAEEFVEAQAEWKKLHEKYPDVAEYESKLLLSGAERNLVRGHHAEAVKTLSPLMRLKGADADDLFEGACFLSRCTLAVAKDDQLSAEKRREMTEDYASQALAMLAEAVKRGWKDAALLKWDQDLAPLRDRAEFTKLLEALQKPTK